jgi:hypothetical protein
MDKALQNYINSDIYKDQQKREKEQTIEAHQKINNKCKCEKCSN